MIVEAFALGLSAGVFCMGYCAPVLMGFLFSREDQQGIGTVMALGLFLSGRLIAYLFFGMISYLTGEIFRGNLFFIRLFPFGEVLLGLLMLVYAIYKIFPHRSFCGRILKWSESRWTLFAAGGFTGMNLCPPFILAAGEAMNSGSLLNSVAFFFIFFISTSIYLIPFAFSGLVGRSERVRSASRIVCGLTGLWFFAGGLEKIFLV